MAGVWYIYIYIYIYAESIGIITGKIKEDMVDLGGMLKRKMYEI